MSLSCCFVKYSFVNKDKLLRNNIKKVYQLNFAKLFVLTIFDLLFLFFT